MRELDLKKFTWNENIEQRDRKQLGFIAQDLEKIMPKSVHTEYMHGLPDCKLVDVSQITMAMFGALKRCITRIDELEEIIKKFDQ